MERSCGVREVLKITGKISFILYKANGEIKDRWEVENLDTTAGKNAVRKQITGDASGGAQPAKFNYIALGTDGTAETIGDTALGAEIGTRVQDTDPAFPADGEAELEVIFAAGNGTGTIAEVGLLNASSGGTLLSRKTVSPTKIKAADESLKVTWKKTVS